MTELLLKDSCKYKVLRYLFTYNKINYVKLQNYLQVSGTTLGRILGSCNKILEKYDLKIEHGKIVGDIKQYVFFYYSFFWVSTIKEKKENSHLINKLVKDIGEKFSLSVIQKEQLFLWILITLKKINKISINDLDSADQKNIEQCTTMPINRYFQKLYRNCKAIYSEDEVRLFAYLLSLFFVSFNMLSYEKAQLGLFRRENPAFELTNKIMAGIKEMFVLEERSQFISIETSIFSLIAQSYYFKGANHTIDRLTFNHYYKMFNNSFREHFVSDIIKNIIEPSNLFDSIKIDEIKKRMVFLIYVLTPREQYCVKIGVVSVVSQVITISSINLLRNELNINQDVIVLPYDEEKRYDLVVSNIPSSMLKNNYSFFFN